MMMDNFEHQFDAVVTVVWERWTNNGRDMDQDERGETRKAVQDVVTNNYIEGISIKDWQCASLKSLGEI